MKKLLMLILLTYTTLALAKEIDVTKSKGTEQSVVHSLTPTVAHMQVSQDTEIKVTFNVALNQKSIQKNEITLKDISQTKKRSIEGDLTYNAEEKSLIFIPTELLIEGYYEISIKSLRTIGEEKDIHIGGIQYRFFVTEQEIINGYVLPPEPDSSVNNSTLLGIDSNANGIRDDVEIYIIKRYAQDSKYPKTKTAIALQYAWASQKILESPTVESNEYEYDAVACESYWARLQTKSLSGFEYVQFRVKHKVFGDSKIKDKIYNTRERINQKFSYNSALSGHILEDKKEKVIDRCRTNINELGE